jgi:hypothetical protein
MKIVLNILAVIICSLNTGAQTKATLTNHILIGNRNLYFSISDEIAEKTPTARFFDEQVFADAPLFWVLHNQSTNYANVHFQGLDHTFEFKLTNAKGEELPLTDHGRRLNSGPILHTNRPIASSIHFISLVSQQVDVRNIPAVEKMFKIPKSGTFLLEVRYWYRDMAFKDWRLSDPVRLKVTNRHLEKTSALISSTPTNRPP